MTYNAQQITDVYNRTRELNPNMAPLGQITDVVGCAYNDELLGFSYDCSGPQGTVIVHMWCCPESLELVASCDY